jgi:hypothetical protein
MLAIYEEAVLKKSMDTPSFYHKSIRRNRGQAIHPKAQTPFTTYIHYHQYTLSTSQTCPKVVPDVTTITVLNAILVDADGSTNPSVTALPTPTGVRSTICLTRLISVVVCARVSKMLPKELSENNRSVTILLAMIKARKVKERGRDK